MTAHTALASRLVVALLGLLLGAQTLRADEAAERASIAKTAQAFVDAFHKGDAEAVAAFWAPNGDYIDVDGRVVQGRAAIAEDYKQLFAMHEGLKLRIDVGSVTFPTPDTAIEDGVTTVIPPDNSTPSRTRYTNLLVKSGGKWMLSSVRESHFTPPGNSEHLRPLAWVIGEWAEVADGQRVGRVIFDWTPDGNYIVALRAVEVSGVILDNGTQRIGWDPATKVIRSWNFEADGGFGDGSWRQVGDTWVNTISAVLPSGSLMTSTTTVTVKDADTITVQSKEQVVDGKSLPDSPVITMKRVR